MSETRDEGILSALGVVYAEHMRWADNRDRAIDGTQERAVAQAVLEETRAIIDGINRLLPPPEPANGPTP